MAIQTRLEDMSIGDKIVSRFHSGGTGTILDLGMAEADPLIPAGGLAPGGAVGKFYFIYVGNDFKGRRILVADRNVMHSISWDSLNTAGYSTKDGVQKEIGADPALWKTSIRLLTGGVSSTTTASSEWDRYIVNGPADIEWNWSEIYSWTSTTGSTSIDRVVRGRFSISEWNGSYDSNYIGTLTGFRPVLVAESLETPKTYHYLIQDQGNVKSYEDLAWSTIAVAPATEEMFVSNGMTDLSLIPIEAWGQLEGMFHILEYINQVEDLKSGLKVEYQDKGSVARTEKLTAVPSDKVILPIGDISVGENVESIILNVVIAVYGDIKVITSTDSGTTWIGKTQVDITDLTSVKANGFTPEEFNALTKDQLTTLFPNGTARFAFYLEQENLTDVVEIQSLTINEKKYTISPTVSDISVIYEVLKSEQPKLFISRDDGVTWKEVSQDEMASLSELPEGNQLRVKALLADGQEVQAISYSWA